MNEFPLSPEKQIQMMKQFGFIQGTVRVLYKDLIKLNEIALKNHLSNLIVDHPNLEIIMHKPTYIDNSDEEGTISVYIKGKIKTEFLEFEIKKNNYLDYASDYYKNIILSYCLKEFSNYQFDSISFSHDPKIYSYRMILKKNNLTIDTIYETNHYKKAIDYFNQTINDFDFNYIFPTGISISKENTQKKEDEKYDKL